ncbi:MAG: long-chain fatty acid--CoA ligase [Acidobacteria bacterium]|nr:MAG: long-chain fatty acid--CoA ligase [Acidobacteriota bacterium]PYV75175.1 MAG: long-chain fatty acid--CoA ligase [Acidobacteriota bacterium]
MSLQTLNDIFFDIAGRDQPHFLLRKTQTGWEPISSKEFATKVGGVLSALRSWGISRGDRVAILSENRHQWVVADFACMLLGAVVVPIYTTLTPEQTSELLRDSGARAIFVSSNKHLEKILSIREATVVEKISIMDDVFDPHAARMTDLMRLPADLHLEASGRAITADDLATIIYTSGTTGTPKGVMLTHGNMAANINYFCRDFGFHAGLISISFLPLSHVTARCVDLGLLSQAVTLAHLPQIDQLPQTLLELRPHILLSVPRVYEKVHTQVEMKAAKSPQKQIYQWAMRTGRAHRSDILAGRTPASLGWKLADALVYSKIRAGLGGRVRIFISGGAPLGRNLAEWYADVGLRICEGYGLTETSPVIAVNTPGAYKIGSVGKPLGNVGVRIAEDGEILVRGPSVFESYWNKPEETRNAFVDRWFKTGDIGRLDEDGFLYVTDRKKDLLKTSGGKFIAPQPIEGSLKHHPFVAEAVVVGDKRKFPSVLIFPNFAALETYCKQQELQFSSREELVRVAEIKACYAEIVSALNKNLAQFEKLKKFCVVADELSCANGTLTASLKLRRRVIEELYRDQIESMYEETKVAR